jgi:hypothetical protein
MQIATLSYGFDGLRAMAFFFSAYFFFALARFCFTRDFTIFVTNA